MYGCGERKMTLIFLVPDCKCAMVKFLEERYTLLLGYDCKTGFATKILDPSSVAYQVQLLTRAHQESQCRKLNLSLFFSCSLQNPASDWFFKQEADWTISLANVVTEQLDPVFSFKDEHKIIKARLQNITCTDTEMRWAMHNIFQQS